MSLSMSMRMRSRMSGVDDARFGGNDQRSKCEDIFDKIRLYEMII